MFGDPRDALDAGMAGADQSPRDGGVDGYA